MAGVSVTAMTKDQLSMNWCWFPGAIDDVRIYDRALSTTEVESLYSRP